MVYTRMYSVQYGQKQSLINKSLDFSIESYIQLVTNSHYIVKSDQDKIKNLLFPNINNFRRNFVKIKN